MDDPGFRDTIHHLIDLTSVAVTLGALAGMLPAISAGLSCVWLAIRIYESDTVQKLIKRKRA